MAATSEETGRAVAEIAAAVTEVAHGAERQVRGVEATREAVQSAARAAAGELGGRRATAQAADQARDVALEGVGAAESAFGGDARGRRVLGRRRRRHQRADRAPQRIGGIVGIITGLAEQTEPARAQRRDRGRPRRRAGRGFAVVAEEVRKLAEESQTAAAEISSLIS